MSQRSVAILAGLAIVLTALVLWTQRTTTPDTGVDTLLLPALSSRLKALDHVIVTKAGDEPLVAAELGASGWVISNKDGYPADVAKIREPLIALSEAKILEPKTANPDLYSHLGVENVSAADAKGVELTLEGGGDPLKLILGNREGQKYRYVRRADAAQSYMIDKDPTMPKSATEWLDRLIVDIDPARIQSISVRHTDGETVNVAKTSREDKSFAVADVPKGRELLYPTVADTMASVLKNLQLDDVAKAGDDDGAQTSVTEWRTFDGLVLTATAFRRGEENWLKFEANYDPELAARFPPPAAKPSTTENGDKTGAASSSESKATGDTAGSDKPAAGTDEAGTAASKAPPALDPQAEAARLGERLTGWRYRLSSYQYDQVARRMENLLKAQEKKP